MKQPTTKTGSSPMEGYNTAPPSGMGPPPGMGPGMGPPPGMGPGMDMSKKSKGRFGSKFSEPVFVGGQIPPEMRAIAPDYSKWRSKLLIMNVNISVVIFLFEMAIFFIFLAEDEIEGPAWVYLLKTVALPTVINFAAVCTEWLLLKKRPEKDRLQDLMVLMTQTVICTVVSTTHYSTMQPMAMFCLPVLTSVVFGSRRLGFITALANVVGLMISVLFRCFGSSYKDIYILPETIVALSLIILATLVSQIVNGLMSEQKMKLIRAISEAKRSQQEALLANNAKSDFLANMSHEIRTPINAILGMNEMILREERNASIREYASKIQTSGTLLLSIINDVLDISKIESGKIEIMTARYDISSLISDCYNMALVRAKDKKLAINVECDENVPRMLLGDESHIRQIIVNLLTNAVKYTEQGTVTFSVSGKHDENGKYSIIISIKDTGIGISEENLGKMFVQFNRFDLERNRNIEGTGLGLTIVKHLVDLMEGTIDVRSRLNEGSTFTVTIPQKVEDETPVGSVQFNYSYHNDYDYIRSFEAPDAHILAVDDLPMNLMVITNMLKDTKVRIDTANSGAAALELSRQNKYDLILMDHMMPDMDGVETLLKLKSDKDTLCGDTPVIMLTANAIAGVRERYMSMGFADYITKPVHGEKLESTVMKYLPPELVTTDFSDEEQPPQEENTEELSALVEALPQLNLKVALPYCCESVELFLDILRQYSESTRLEEMTEQFEKEDFENYRINAHSLKSTSLTVGLEGLSERARASEFALKVGNIEFVKLNHPELMEMYSGALEKIRAYLNDTDEKQ